MSWICPNCHKEFRNVNQWHSCARLSIEDHIKNKPEFIQRTTSILIEKIKVFGDMEFNPVKSTIQVKAGATFLSIKPKKDVVELEFQLPYEINEFPIVKNIRISGKRVLHHIYIDNPVDIDEQLMTWINESYQLVKSSSKE